jgi:hypothetical protein
MPKLIPQCVRCGSPVTNSIESQIKQHEKIKFGRYIDNIWMCDDCHKKREENNVPMGDKSNNKQHDISDVSPNTPITDESG